MDLDTIFKAYDVRGLFPEQLDEEAARRIGAAFARFADASRIAVGRDCRESSPLLATALIEGINSQGVAVDDLGMITTDMVYYAAGSLAEPGVMITASHNPKGYNGIKLCLAGAAPVGEETGLMEIKASAAAGLTPVDPVGRVKPTDILGGYVEHVLSIVEPHSFDDLLVGVDGGNGVAGVAVPAVFDRLPARLRGLYLEPDGPPQSPPRPTPCREPPGSHGFDARGGARFGGGLRRGRRSGVLHRRPTQSPARQHDDRHGGRLVSRSGSGASIVHNLICSRAVPETVVAHGGTPVRTRVGHSFIKGVMKETGHGVRWGALGALLLQGELPGRFGILAMLVLLQLLSEAGRPLSEVRKDFEPYAQSGEINFEVHGQAESAAAVAEAFDGEKDHLDGLTVSWDDRWFNLRPSNTEPVLRLNVEAPDAGRVDELVAAVQSVLEVGGGVRI